MASVATAHLQDVHCRHFYFPNYLGQSLDCWDVSGLLYIVDLSARLMPYACGEHCAKRLWHYAAMKYDAKRRVPCKEQPHAASAYRRLAVAATKPCNIIRHATLQRARRIQYDSMAVTPISSSMHFIRRPNHLMQAA